MVNSVSQQHAIDKSAWPRGPWDDEPDTHEWINRASGYDCFAQRSDITGAWCGYVGLPKGHPWWEKHYTQLPDLKIHGGLTFAGRFKDKHGVWGFWLIGFDCSHSWDYRPAMAAKVRSLGAQAGRYWTLGAVKREVARLAVMAREAAA